MRTGKIARMPVGIRDELCRRMRNGEMGAELLAWLNAQPEAQQVVNQWFGGQAVNAQNLSDWRKGGYADWETREGKTHRVKDLAEFASKLALANGGSIAEGASAIVSGRLLEILEAAEDGPTLDVEQLRAVAASLAALRGADTAKSRVELDAEKLKRKDEEIALAKAAFEQRLKEYQDKVAERKREIEGVLDRARAGGLTPETLATIEEKVKLL